jgi:DNA repair protein SbcC/Rad50
MIPIKLHLAGFLSYQDAVDLDFSGFELACISGQNGAGKSSLLEAITWVLFGEARGRDDEALINKSEAVNAAEVIYDFEYEGNTYRVQRSKPRGKTTLLEFFILSPESGWRPLTEKSVRETENRLRQTLRMDYDTFINASFFLQGRADQFAQQNPSNRKKVLSSILGLEAWESYRQQTAEQRKLVELELHGVDAQLAEIDAELGQEIERKARLTEIEARLQQLNDQRRAREAALEALRRLASSLNEQKRLVDVLEGRLSETRGRADRLDSQLTGLRADFKAAEDKMVSSDRILAGYQAWQEARLNLEHWDQMAASFHEVQARRAVPMAEIAAARSRLEEERRGMALKALQAEREQEQVAGLEKEIPLAREKSEEARDRLAQRVSLEADIRAAQQESADLDAENRRLRTEMTALKERIERLKQTEGAECPLCGQPLTPSDRATLIAGLESEGKLMGDTFRANQRRMEETAQHLRDLNTSLGGFAALEEEMRRLTRRLDQIEAEVMRLNQAQLAWEQSGKPRMEEIDQTLADENYARDARTRLSEIDAEARLLGYDTSAHDAARKNEQLLRTAERELRELESARAAYEPLKKQIAGLELQREHELAEAAVHETEFMTARTKYQADSTSMPDLDQAEQEALAAQSEENRLRMETGMVRQLVAVLDTQRQRKTKLGDKWAEYALDISRLKVLEKAFGKDGVPALLIEQALPEIETQANDLLDRLTAGSMSVRFNTQRQLKSKDEKRETLDILISDNAGTREYEMFSGGEAFRVNFAIRLALSRVLAHRAGARLQTLFIDEGFGSQDSDGRQRLLEAINLVRPEFARILVITHLEELKDAFPARIEVEKTARGSSVRMTV